ncbi:MAG: cadmium-translocating P-type ATPase [Candidatus Sumerlaeia bacterium]|nr:cadmium-translocating P-type ATPase [Candidatus Sumerlaeia bacterium]
MSPSPRVAPTGWPLWKWQFAHAAVCLLALAAGWALEGVAPVAAWVLLGISFLAGARYPMVEALESLRELTLDVDTLMLLVAGGAVALGHPEEGAFLLVLFTASRAMESYAEARTKSALEELTTEFPQRAWRVVGDGEEEIAVDSLVAGDRIRVRPGEYVPVDCIVVQGQSTADVAALTGEEEPLALDAGVEVPSGAVNGMGLIVAEVLRPAAESAYQKILNLIRHAPERRSPAQDLSDRAGRFFTWGILAAAVGGFLWWWRVTGLAADVAMYRAMALLVAGSPCALVLSVPSGVLAAITAGARRGILFHGGRGLMGAATVRTIAFDKTGTLTTGEPTVREVTGGPDAAALRVALALASSSTHPASRAVRTWLEGQGIEAEPGIVRDITEVPGEGMRGTFADVEVRLGRHAAGTDADDGHPSVVLSHAGRALARFVLQETLRPSASCLAALLRARGLRIVLLSGDRPATAERLAASVGITEARGGLAPEDKYRLIDEARGAGAVMMVGDGVNDAPALARADVGVAMGMRGSAAALAQADIVLVKDRLGDLPAALALSRHARRIIHQNIAIAVGAAAILVAFALAGRLPLALGVLGHEGGTVLVVLNSLRLLAFRADDHRIEPVAATAVPTRLPES